MILFFPYTLSLKDLIQVHDLNTIYMLTAPKFSPISVQNSRTHYPTVYLRFILGCQIDYLKFSTFKHELPLSVPSDCTHPQPSPTQLSWCQLYSSCSIQNPCRNFSPYLIHQEILLGLPLMYILDMTTSHHLYGHLSGLNHYFSPELRNSPHPLGSLFSHLFANSLFSTQQPLLKMWVILYPSSALQPAVAPHFIQRKSQSF